MLLAILPLFAFLFETPALAAAAAGGAVSIPIIIHLLNRKRYRIVPWAAMRFLLAAQRKTSRKVRIEQTPAAGRPLPVGAAAAGRHVQRDAVGRGRLALVRAPARRRRGRRGGARTRSSS